MHDFLRSKQAIYKSDCHSTAPPAPSWLSGANASLMAMGTTGMLIVAPSLSTTSMGASLSPSPTECSGLPDRLPLGLGLGVLRAEGTGPLQFKPLLAMTPQHRSKISTEKAQASETIVQHV